MHACMHMHMHTTIAWAYIRTTVSIQAKGGGESTSQGHIPRRDQGFHYASKPAQSRLSSYAPELHLADNLSSRCRHSGREIGSRIHSCLPPNEPYAPANIRSSASSSSFPELFLHYPPYRNGHLSLLSLHSLWTREEGRCSRHKRFRHRSTATGSWNTVYKPVKRMIVMCICEGEKKPEGVDGGRHVFIISKYFMFIVSYSTYCCPTGILRSASLPEEWDRWP